MPFYFEKLRGWQCSGSTRLDRDLLLLGSGQESVVFNETHRDSFNSIDVLPLMRLEDRRKFVSSFFVVLVIDSWRTNGTDIGYSASDFAVGDR